MWCYVSRPSACARGIPVFVSRAGSQTAVMSVRQGGTYVRSGDGPFAYVEGCQLSHLDGNGFTLSRLIRLVRIHSRQLRPGGALDNPQSGQRPCARRLERSRATHWRVCSRLSTGETPAAVNMLLALLPADADVIERRGRLLRLGDEHARILGATVDRRAPCRRRPRSRQRLTP